MKRWAIYAFGWNSHDILDGSEKLEELNRSKTLEYFKMDTSERNIKERTVLMENKEIESEELYF